MRFALSTPPWKREVSNPLFYGVPMSTSPDAPKGENLAPRPTLRALWANNPVLILLKGLLWAALAVAAVTLLAMNYEIVWDMLVEAVPLGLEIAEKTLDTFFETVVRLNPGFASIATAYTGFVLFLVALYLLSRKAITVYKKAQAKKSELGAVYRNAWTQVCDSARAAFFNWWNSLGFADKVVAMVAFVLLGIPLALLLSFVLGSLVANLL